MLGRQTRRIGGVIKPRIHLSQAAILFRKAGPPLATVVCNAAPLVFNVSPARARPPTPQCARSGLNSRHELPSVAPPGGFAFVNASIAALRGAAVHPGSRPAPQGPDTSGHPVAVRATDLLNVRP